MNAPSLEQLIGRFWQKVSKTDGCWNWTASLTSNGYGQMSVGHGRVPVRAHRFSWEINCGSIPEGMFVCHRCDNPRCVRPDHLFLGTNQDNVDDMMQKGRNDYSPQSGEHNSRSLLTEKRVIEMRGLRAAGAKLIDLSNQFGVAVPTVHHVITGKTWAHVPGYRPKGAR